MQNGGMEEGRGGGRRSEKEVCVCVCGGVEGNKGKDGEVRGREQVEVPARAMGVQTPRGSGGFCANKQSLSCLGVKKSAEDEEGEEEATAL